MNRLSHRRLAAVPLVLCRTAATLAAAAALLPAAVGRADPPVAWRSGADFQRQLQTTVGVAWAANPLRSALTNLSRNQQVVVMLDRRIDPDQPVDFVSGDVPLDALFRGLAARLGIGLCYIGPVAYFGPAEETGRLATAVQLRTEELRRLPPAVRDRLARRQAWQWERLTTPREILAEWSRQSGVAIVNAEEAIPHDLWPAVELPPLNFVERLSLVAGGFGLTFEWAPDGSAVRLTPLPERLTIERSYTVGASAARMAEQMGEAFPEGRFRAQGGTLHVDASADIQDAVARLLRGERVAPPSGRAGPQPVQPSDLRRVYTLKIENVTLGALLKRLAEEPGVEIEADPRYAPQLQQRVSIDVRDVTIEALLEAALNPAGLTFRREEGVFVIGRP